VRQSGAPTINTTGAFEQRIADVSGRIVKGFAIGR
jgi:hypothetical protein